MSNPYPIGISPPPHQHRVEPPRLFETSQVFQRLWKIQRVETYVCRHDRGVWSTSLSELRKKLGRGSCTPEEYQLRVAKVATYLYEPGHQRTASDAIYELFIDPEGYASLPPINPAYRTWTEEDKRIADQF